MVPATIPFAVAAAFFPPAVAVVLWLLASPPRFRRGLVYLSGAATSTLGSGAAILALLHAVEIAPGRTTAIEAMVQIVLGGAFLLFAGGLALRRPQLLQPDRAGAAHKLSARGYVGIFLLGVAMWTPSVAYVAAIDLIVTSGLTLPSQILNLVVVVVIVLCPVELPLLLYRLAPAAVTEIVARIDTLVHRYFWQLGVITAAGGGTYLLVRGSVQLPN
jgi:hypothetical protein